MRKYTLRDKCVAILTISAFCGSLLSNAHAAENATFTYDALGRLTATSTTGSVNNGKNIGVAYDPAGNRSNYSVTGTGSQNPPCSLSAWNAEGNDEFTVYAGVQKNGSCADAVSVNYTVQYVSGSGQYGVGSLIGGQTINPSESYKLLQIYAYYGTVPPGSPLVLRVTWNVVSGNGTISPAQGTVTFYNSDCYC